MKRRPVEIEVSDHAVLRWLERAHGLDTDAIRLLIAGQAIEGAELGAIAVVVAQVRLVLRDVRKRQRDGVHEVVVVSVLDRSQPVTLPGKRFS